jgi:hypothetical protein
MKPAIALLLAADLLGCAQRIALKRTPYGIEDLVYIPVRYFEVTYPESAPGAACTLMDIVFLPNDGRSQVTYQLQTQLQGGPDWQPVEFAYELAVVSLPSEQDQAYRRAGTPGRMNQARNTERKLGAQTCRSPATDAAATARHVLHFEGPLVGSLKVALLTASGHLRPGSEYRLSFFHDLPGGRPDSSPTIGQFEFRVVNNTNYVGLPVGLGLGFGFLVVTTKFLAP